MIAPDLKTAIDELRELVARSAVVVPFTGAGISTECGIPDFRSPGGIWTKMRPIDFSDFLASQEARDESWRRRFAMEESFGGAKPGRGHQALASLYRAGKSPGVGHSEHRQPAPSLWHRSRTCCRTARQHDLRHLPRLRDALRVALGQAVLRGERPRAVLSFVRRPHQDRHRLVRPSDARRGDAPRRGTDAARPICSLRSVPRWWCGRPPAFR